MVSNLSLPVSTTDVKSPYPPPRAPQLVKYPWYAGGKVAVSIWSIYFRTLTLFPIPSHQATTQFVKVDGKRSLLLLSFFGR